MAELKRESMEALATIAEQTAAPVHSNEEDSDGGKKAGIVAGTYDALDYRLMATFPASDAVAKY